jgi:hypothetical protein
MRTACSSSFKPPAQRQQIPQLHKPRVGHLKKLALALGDQIRHIGAVFGVILIPAPVQGLRLSAMPLLDTSTSICSCAKQPARQRLVVIAGRLQSVYDPAQSMLKLKL